MSYIKNIFSSLDYFAISSKNYTQEEVVQKPSHNFINKYPIYPETSVRPSEKVVIGFRLASE